MGLPRQATLHMYNPSFLGRLRQEDHKVKIHLGYIARQGLKTKWQDFIGSRAGGRSRDTAVFLGQLGT